MKSAIPFNVVLVTTPNLSVARSLARAALKQRLIACANVVPRIESLYWWQGTIESSQEALLIMKTRRALLHRLEDLIVERHPYDTPELLALPLRSGSQRYLDWLTAETQALR
jgi:periplasmic divalent cation tolerance protein